MSRPSTLDVKFVQKIAKKIGRNELDVRKSASEFGRRRKLPLEVALIIFAENNNVGTSDARRKLDSHKLSILDRALNRNDGTSKSEVPVKGIRKRKIKIPLFDLGDYADPYLSMSMYDNLPTEAYGILFVLENSIREFVERELSESYGDQWWSKVRKMKSLSKTVSSASDRKTKESDHWYHSKRGAHEIYYTDYVELLQIIRVFDAVFSKLFKKGAAKNLVGKLEELTPTRNVVAHNNPITAADLGRLKIHAHDWFSYMQYLKQNENYEN